MGREAGGGRQWAGEGPARVPAPQDARAGGRWRGRGACHGVGGRQGGGEGPGAPTCGPGARPTSRRRAAAF